MASPFPTPGPPTITFLGRVIPEAVNFYFTKVLEYEWPMENGLRVMMRPSINKSIIRVECYANRNNPEDIMALHMRAMDISRAIVNLACFSSGHGAQVVLDKLITSAGAEKTLVIRDQRIAAFATSFSLATQPNSDLDKMLGVVLMEPPLFMALDDLIASIALPHHAPINCARAIDAIRNMIAPGLSTSKQWAALRENLNVSKDYLKLITDTSIAPRHGDHSFIPAPTMQEISKRTWLVMDRFLEFRKRGNQPLPLTGFPELVA